MCLNVSETIYEIFCAFQKWHVDLKFDWDFKVRNCLALYATAGYAQ